MMLRLSRNSNMERFHGRAGRALVAASLLGTVALPAAVLAGTGAVPGDPGRMARARHLMGTRLSIELADPAGEEVFEAAFAEVARLEQVMSNWSATSEISRLNREAFARPFRCSGDLFAALSAVLRFAEQTDGAFEPTVEPLVRRLGLRGPEGRLPGESGAEALGAAFEAPGDGDAPIGWRHVHLDAASREVRFDAAGVGIDLGGIGKGIALDAAAEALRAGGVRAALLDFGGQMLAFGAPRGARGWPIGIADPDDRDRPAAALVLRDGSIATSGTGERSVEGPDGSVGHILDPRRRRPASFAGTLTVQAADGTTADALSTALFVMGPRRGVHWAGERGVGALYLWRGSGGARRSRMTPSFRRMLQEGASGRPERGPDAASPTP